MTDDQIILGMIPAKVLDSLNSDDDLTLQSFINQGYNFPWDEFGVYQKAASLLPLSLSLEVPEPELKDKVALRLIKLVEEQRAMKAEEEEKATVVEDTEETISTVVDEQATEDTKTESVDEPMVDEFQTIATPDEPDSLVEDMSEIQNEPVEQIEEFAEIENDVQSIPESPFVDENINLESEALLNDDSVNPKESYEDSSDLIENYEVPQPEELDNNVNAIEETIAKEPETEVAPVATQKEKMNINEFTGSSWNRENGKKTIDEKMYLTLEHDFDDLKSSVNESERRVTKNLLMAYVAIAVLLALLIFSFFKFTSDINSLENEVKDLKKHATSELLGKQNINLDSFFRV